MVLRKGPLRRYLDSWWPFEKPPKTLSLSAKSAEQNKIKNKQKRQWNRISQKIKTKQQT